MMTPAIPLSPDNNPLAFKYPARLICQTGLKLYYLYSNACLAGTKSNRLLSFSPRRKRPALDTSEDVFGFIGIPGSQSR